MKCLWRRTLVSVLALLLPHKIPCQNVIQNSPPLALLREPSRDYGGTNQINQQQMNVFPSPKYVLPEFLSQNQLLPEYQQRMSEYSGPGYPQTNTVSQYNNIAQLPQGVTFVNPQLKCFPQIQNQVSNALPVTNAPTSLPAPSMNIQTIPRSANKQFINAIPVIDLLPMQENSRKPFLPSENIAKCPNVDIPSDTKLPLLPETKVSQAPIVTNFQNQVLSNPPISLVPSGSVLNMQPVPRNPIQNTPTSMSNQYSQSFGQVPTNNAPCKLTTDLTSLNFLPTPNLPVPVSIQKSVPISQAPVQPIVYSKPIVPVDYASNTPVSTNCQISALPPVFPAIAPQLNNNLYRSFRYVKEENSPVPINLHINMPCPTIPEPQITVITAYPPPPPAPVSTADSDVSFGLYPSYPLPPIIIESRRSKSRKWLPLILIALIANDGCCGGGCCCCCSCDTSSDPIPIPYPIPIPTSNPLIIGSASKT